MEPVRWGVLSTSSFAENKFIPGLRGSPLVDVVAVASRDGARAADYAARTGIPVSYGSYEELLADPAVEVVYNPLPNDLHVEWTRRAAEAGKHVMCEKPMGMNAAEVATLLPLASRVHIAEAFMVRWSAQWAETGALVASGALGRLTHAHVEFAYTNSDAANIRNIPGSGGGAMYDIGCYAVVAARWFFGADPVRVAASVDRDPVFGTDRMTSALMVFADGRTCTFTVSTQSVFHQRVHVFGTDARLEITVPFNQPPDEPTVYFVHRGTTAHGFDAQRHEVATADQYTAQGEGFSRRVRNEAPGDAPLRDAMVNMAVIDAVFRSAGSGRFEAV